MALKENVDIDIDIDKAKELIMTKPGLQSFLSKIKLMKYVKNKFVNFTPAVMIHLYCVNCYIKKLEA